MNNLVKVIIGCKDWSETTENKRGWQENTERFYDKFKPNCFIDNELYELYGDYTYDKYGNEIEGVFVLKEEAKETHLTDEELSKFGFDFFDDLKNWQDDKILENQIKNNGFSFIEHNKSLILKLNVSDKLKTRFLYKWLYSTTKSKERYELFGCTLESIGFDTTKTVDINDVEKLVSVLNDTILSKFNFQTQLLNIPMDIQKINEIEENLNYKKIRIDAENNQI